MNSCDPEPSPRRLTRSYCSLARPILPNGIGGEPNDATLGWRGTRTRIMPPVEAYSEDLLREVLKTFYDLEERANEKGNEIFNNYRRDEYTDPLGM